MKKSLALTLMATAASSAEGDDQQQQEQIIHQPKCSLYLAPSVPGINAEGGNGGGGINMGVFAGVDYPPGSVVGNPDIVVPIVDVRAQIGTRKNRFATDKKEVDEGEGEEHHTFDWHWSDYVWEPRALGAAGEGVDSKVAAHGLGSLVRGSSSVEPNVVPTRATYDSAGLHRSKDPNAGGISYYHGMKTIATKPIEAGAELFSDFGMHYFTDREGEEFGADAVGEDPDSQSGQAMVDGQGDNLEGPAASGKSGLWGMLWDNKGAFKRMMPQVIGGGAGTGAAAVGGTSGKEGNHSTEWLSTHGYCLDNIVPSPSKIGKAGRGAFASRPIVAGAVIAPAPVIHLPDRDVLDVRAPREDGHNAESYEDLMTDEVTGKQLLLNYCFGHSDSSMLLCPVGSVTGLINHATNGVAEPNAEIRWSSSANMSNATWLNMTLDELDDEKRIGLVLEYVALRDIQPGEEILIDYGREWEEAWRDHVKSWTPAEEGEGEGSERYTDAADLNEMYRNSPIRTMQEQIREPYPVNVETSCYYDYVPDAGLRSDAERLRPDDPSSPLVFTRRWLYGMDQVGTNLRPCRILRREDGDEDSGSEELYTARILNCDETHHDARIPDDERILVTDIPRSAVVLTNRLYTTDMHLPNVFRHEMMIPDGMFPEAWRNL